MLFRRNLLRQGRDKGLRRPDPPDPFRKTGQLLPRLAKSTGNVRFPTIRFLRQKNVLYVSRFRRQSQMVSVKVVGYSLQRPTVYGCGRCVSLQTVRSERTSDRIEYAVTIV